MKWEDYAVLGIVSVNILAVIVVAVLSIIEGC